MGDTQNLPKFRGAAPGIAGAHRPLTPARVDGRGTARPDCVYSRSVTNTGWAGNSRTGSLDNLERSKRREIMATREALAFDMYGTLVDPIRIWKQLEQYAPDEAQRTVEIWRQKQLEFTFRLTAMDRYEDFEQVTRKALDYALAVVSCNLDAQKGALMAQYNHLERFPDVEPGLQRLKE